MPRTLSLLAAFASPVFLCAAIAGWLFEVWPATPLTLGVSAVLVTGGPILGILHVATAGRDDDVEIEEEQAMPTLVIQPAPEPIKLTAKAEAARRFANWRDTPNEAITQRERARRANQHARG
ncbi:hypothetical protein [Solirubrobacter soli]|uniref:hypothetical protein n=1 Tax=Solirubrobacter soli TaxID=363832 RepID=UPI00041842CB|nr:hypothetical protein [Solirubrobacter soli]